MFKKRRLPKGFPPRVNLHECEGVAVTEGANQLVVAKASARCAPGNWASSSADTFVLAETTPRGDAPVLRPSKRGCRVAALAAADDLQSKRSALGMLQAQVHASSAQGPLESLWSTWCEFHLKWFGPDVGVLPLTRDKIFCVAAMFKQGGYQSFQKYLSRAKDRHIQDGHLWSALLDSTCRKAVRSVLRGIGAPRQSGPLPPLEVWDRLALDRVAYTPDGPSQPVAMFVVSVFFLLRELEASVCLASRVSFDRARNIITLQLSASKTDPKALSVTRTWGCICSGKLAIPCPYHAGLSNYNALVANFGSCDGDLPTDLTFFPSNAGEVVSKASVVQAFEGIATDLGLPTLSPDGHKVFGGHSARVTGAQQLSAPPFCMELLLLQLLARWAGPTILRYAQEAPLLSLTSVVGKTVQQHSSSRELGTTDDSLEKMRTALTTLQSRVDDVSVAGADHLRQLTELKASLQSSCCSDEYIINEQTSKYHRPLVYDRHITPGLWKTWCGWPFAFSRFRSSSTPPGNSTLFCGTCFPTAEPIDSEGSDSSCVSESSRTG